MALQPVANIGFLLTVGHMVENFGFSSGGNQIMSFCNITLVCSVDTWTKNDVMLRK